MERYTEWFVMNNHIHGRRRLGADLLDRTSGDYGSSYPGC